MKKLALVVGSLLSSFELLAGNFVPVCLNVGDDQKASVYKAIVENSFVTQLDSERAAKLSEEDKNEIINDESGFLKKKIQSVDPSAKVAFIPKSLYQLFIENYYFDDLISGVKNSHMNKELFREAVSNNPTWGDSGIGFGSGWGSPKSISDFCNNYMDNENVKSYFWKINDSIIPFFDGISVEQVRDSKNLEKITKMLFNNISPNAKIIFDLMPGYFCQHLFANYTRLLTKVDTDGTVMEVDLENNFVKMIVDLVVEESKTPENIYRIYRGEWSDRRSDRDSTRFYSFSDGMFGGIIRDWESGMAFNCAIPRECMKIIDLPKEKLLNVEANSNGVEISGLSVHIPPILSMGAALGAGEFHHVRTKIQVDLSNNKGMTGFEEASVMRIPWLYSYVKGMDGLGEVSITRTPWLYSYTSPVENFWKRWELVTDKSYDIVPNSYTPPVENFWKRWDYLERPCNIDPSFKVLNVKTFKLTSGE